MNKGHLQIKELIKYKPFACQISLIYILWLVNPNICLHCLKKDIISSLLNICNSEKNKFNVNTGWFGVRIHDQSRLINPFFIWAGQHWKLEPMGSFLEDFYKTSVHQFQEDWTLSKAHGFKVNTYIRFWEKKNFGGLGGGEFPLGTCIVCLELLMLLFLFFFYIDYGLPIIPKAYVFKKCWF